MNNQHLINLLTESAAAHCTHATELATAAQVRGEWDGSEPQLEADWLYLMDLQGRLLAEAQQLAREKNHAVRALEFRN